MWRISLIGGTLIFEMNPSNRMFQAESQVALESRFSLGSAKSMNANAPNVSWIALLKRAAAAWTADKALRLSAALAYYSVFSIAPLLVITIAVAGLLFGDAAIAGDLHAQLRSYIGSPAAKALQSMVESAAKPAEGLAATITGFVVLMLGASGVFGALKDALNTIWKVKSKGGSGIRGLAHEKFLNFGMVLVIGFLLLISLVLSTAIASLHDRLEAYLVLPAFVWTAVTSLVSMLVATTLFAWIFKVLPDVRMRWRDVWLGALLTAVLFELGKTGLGWYLGRESTANAYGAAGSVVLLLLWIYYASCILLFGAELTQVYARASGRHVVPAPGSEWATIEDRQREGMDPCNAKPPLAAQPACESTPASLSSQNVKQETVESLDRGRVEISEQMDWLRATVNPKQVLSHAVQSHAAMMLGTAFAIGVAVPALLIRRHRELDTLTPREPRPRFIAQIAGVAMSAVLPRMVTPLFQNWIKRRLSPNPSPPPS